MFIDTAKYKKGDKTYTRHLLRDSYRDKQDGKVKHHTIASLNKCSDDEILAIKLALKYKNNLTSLVNISAVNLQQGKLLGAITVLNKVINDLGIKKALSVLKDAKQVNLALWQIMSRIIYQGSKLCAFRMAKFQALKETLGLDEFTKDDLYHNLELLAEDKLAIEKKLFQQRYKNAIPRLFLYDVTSSYLEGEENHYAAYGYNRDKKTGKMQIVIGLLTDEDGTPLASRIFDGNRADSQTVAEQIRTLSTEFGIKEAIMVGDRAMFKLPQIELLPENFKYITAISKSQIEKLIKDNKLQLELFDEDLTEITINNERYICRRNPSRAQEIEQNRLEKINKLQQLCQKKNAYLAEHTRAKLSTASKQLQLVLNKYKLPYVSLIEQERSLELSIDQIKLKQVSQLDGCYCIKTDVSLDCAKETIHARYKDLAKVEYAFKNFKTQHLELRPIYVRKKDSTDAHVLITTLAYMVVQHLEKIWQESELKVPEAISLLNTISYQIVNLDEHKIIKIPTPNEEIQKFLHLAKVILPSLKS